MHKTKARSQLTETDKSWSLGLLTVNGVPWLAGAGVLLGLALSQTNVYGFEQSPQSAPSVSVGFFLPAVLTVPLAVTVDWARRTAHPWLLSTISTTVAVLMAVSVPAFVLTLRFAGDREPVASMQTDFAWQMYLLTAGLHALTLGVAARRNRW